MTPKQELLERVRRAYWFCVPYRWGAFWIWGPYEFLLHNGGLTVCRNFVVRKTLRAREQKNNHKDH